MALIDVERHTDPFVELLRANLTGENLRQGDGRARAARRELWNSVLILINTSAEIDRTVARLTTTQKRDALAGFIAPALHLGALPIGGHGNRQGFQFQAIARAALARMGNPTGAMPDGADNPALLVQAGEEVSPTLCKDRLRGVLHGELWRLLNEIIQVFENGEQFELYEVGGWLPFARFGWHRVEVKVNGHAYAGFAIGTTADDATSRYRRVLSDGFAVMTDPANAVNDARDGEFVPLTPTSVSIEPDKRLEKLRAAWVDRGVIPLTGGALHDVLPELFGSRETAKRALADMRQSMVDQAIAGQVAMGGSAVELSGQKRAGENDKGPEVELENPYKEIAPILTYFADGLSFSPDSESDVVTQSMVDLQGFDAEFASFVGLSSNVAGGAPAALVRFKNKCKSGRWITAAVTMGRGIPESTLAEAADQLRREREYGGIWSDDTYILHAEHAVTQAEAAEAAALAAREEARAHAAAMKAEFNAGRATKAETRAATAAKTAASKVFKEAQAAAVQARKEEREQIKILKRKYDAGHRGVGIVEQHAGNLISLATGIKRLDVELLAIAWDLEMVIPHANCPCVLGPF